MASAKTRNLVPEAVAPNQGPCTITFGHNVSVRQVCLLLSTPTSQLIFSPEDAEDVASKLMYYANAARGQKPS